MPIRSFLEHDHSFGPEDIAKMSAAFEAALGKLGLVDRTDPNGGRQDDYRTSQTGRTRRRAALRLGIAATSKLGRMCRGHSPNTFESRQ
jgi:hypothetical protein